MSLLARFSLANRGLVALIAVVITVFGAFAIPSLKQQLLPSLEFPAAFIVRSLPGAGPEIVESQVTEPIENALQGIPGLEQVTSTSREGSATVQVTFEFGTDLDDAVNKMQTALSRIDAQLPEGVDPQVIAGSTDDLPAVVLAAAGGGGRAGAAPRSCARRWCRSWRASRGSATVEVTGARDDSRGDHPGPGEAGRREASQPTRDRHGAADQRRGGSGRRGDRRRAGPSRAGRHADHHPGATCAASYLTAGRGARSRLGDVATVEQQLAPATVDHPHQRQGQPRHRGHRRAGRQRRCRSRTRSGTGSPTCRTASGAELTVVFDQAPFVEKSIEALTTEGLLGLVMAVIVILVFLLSVRSTLVTAVSIPLSVLVALIALWIGDYSLNLLTLGALTIAVGRVVDDSIVVLENIKRHLEYGEEKRHAILTARPRGGRRGHRVDAHHGRGVRADRPGRRLRRAALRAVRDHRHGGAARLAAGVADRDPGARVLVPQAAAAAPPTTRRSGAAAEEKELRSPLQRAYLPVIGFATRTRSTRWITVGLGLLVLFGTVRPGAAAGDQLPRPLRPGHPDISQKLPAGTSLAATDAAAKQVEAVLARTDGVETYQVTVGGGGQPVRRAAAATTAPAGRVALDGDTDAQADAARRCASEFDELGAGVGEISFGGGQGGARPASCEVIVQAADPEALTRAAEQVRAAMAGVAGRRGRRPPAWPRRCRGST